MKLSNSKFFELWDRAAWYRSMDKKGGVNPISSFLMSKKWTFASYEVVFDFIKKNTCNLIMDFIYETFNDYFDIQYLRRHRQSWIIISSVMLILSNLSTFCMMSIFNGDSKCEGDCLNNLREYILIIDKDQEDNLWLVLSWSDLFGSPLPTSTGLGDYTLLKLRKCQTSDSLLSNNLHTVMGEVTGEKGKGRRGNVLIVNFLWGVNVVVTIVFPAQFSTKQQKGGGGSFCSALHAL